MFDELITSCQRVLGSTQGMQFTINPEPILGKGLKRNRPKKYQLHFWPPVTGVILPLTDNGAQGIEGQTEEQFAAAVNQFLTNVENTRKAESDTVVD